MASSSPPGRRPAISRRARGIVIALVLVASLGAISAASANDGQLEPQIVNGTDATNPGFVVAILSRATADTYDAQNCGGALIASDVVLTAAHCVDDVHVTRVEVTIGVSVLSDIAEQQRLRVADIRIHPGWTGEEGPDLALLRLAAPLEAITPVSWIDDPSLPQRGDVVELFGWGARSQSRSNYPDQIQQTSMMVQTDVDNDFGIPCFLESPSDDFCYGGTGSASCSGDSGSPILVRDDADAYVVAGVVSYGPGAGCGVEPFFDGGQRVSPYLDWLQQQLDRWANGPVAEIAPPGCDPAAVPFTDVATTSFAYADVECLYGTGITNGTSATTFSPGAVVTREQLVAFLGRSWVALDNRCEFAALPFTDIDTQSFAYGALSCVYDLGIARGTSMSTFSPNDGVTREQMAAFLARTIRAHGANCPSGAMPFGDVDPTSFAYNDISCLFELGITQGTGPGTYGPDDIVTREQMASFLARTIRSLTAA